MANAKAKTIKLLLHSGDLDGVISMADSSWGSGELYMTPRNSIKELLSTDACNKYGVYLLLSKNMVYVGQSTDLAKRINQHTFGKDWWTSVVILTTKDDSLNRSDIDYLEYNLIEMANEIQKLDCDNKRKGNEPKVDKFRKVELQQYLEEALFLMKLIGVNVFSNGKKTRQEKGNNTLINTMALKTGKNAKKEAIEYLKSQNIAVGPNITYAVRQSNKDVFWANPREKMINVDWDIILNDNIRQELIVMHIPANTLNIYDGKTGLKVRNDLKDRIDINIKVNSLVDWPSRIDFSKYVIKIIKY